MVDERRPDRIATPDNDSAFLLNTPSDSPGQATLGA